MNASDTATAEKAQQHFKDEVSTVATAQKLRLGYAMCRLWAWPGAGGQ